MTKESAEEFLVAGIDLGSNSFKLMIARVKKKGNEFHLREIDTIKSTVRLASGLSEDNVLSDEIIDKALNALMRFGDRLQNFPKKNVCVIATNTFRIGTNSKILIKEGEKLLGFPIKILSGEEEAKLVFKGSSHVSPVCKGNRLVIDLGGGSTEIILGEENNIKAYDSLQLGCVTWTKKFFSDGKITEQKIDDAINHARSVALKVYRKYKKLPWSQVIGSSGSSRALADIISLNHFDDINKLPINDVGGTITLKGLQEIKKNILLVSNISDIKIEGLKNERRPVLLGGLTALIGLFEVFDIKQMEVSESAIIYGALHDALLTNIQEKNKNYTGIHKKIMRKKDSQINIDRRSQVVNDWAEQFSVDLYQANRLSVFSANLFKKINKERDEIFYNSTKLLNWACILHEIGLVINYRQYQYHSSYIISHKELTTFTNEDQARLASLVMGHKSRLDKLNFNQDYIDWGLLISLRLAFIVYKKRSDYPGPKIDVKKIKDKIIIKIEKKWFYKEPFIKYGIIKEASLLKKISSKYEIIFI